MNINKFNLHFEAFLSNENRIFSLSKKFNDLQQTEEINLVCY